MLAVLGAGDDVRVPAPAVDRAAQPYASQYTPSTYTALGPPAQNPSPGPGAAITTGASSAVARAAAKSITGTKLFDPCVAIAYRGQQQHTQRLPASTSGPIRSVRICSQNPRSGDIFQQHGAATIESHADAYLDTHEEEYVMTDDNGGFGPWDD